MTTSTGTAVTIAQTITVLKHLAAGRQPDFAAQVTHLPQRVVEDIAEKYGWPDPDAVRKGIFDLTRAEQDTPAAPPSTPAPRPAAPVAQARPDLTVARPTRPTPPAPPAEHRQASPSAGELIVAASRSPKKRTQALGVKVAALLGDLARILREEEEQTEAARQKQAEDAKRKARIEQLEQELARLKGQKPRQRNTSNIGGATHGDYSCGEQDCGRTFTTLQGINLHRRRAHDLPALRATDAA